MTEDEDEERNIEEVRENLRKYEEKYGDPEVSKKEGGDITVTNDPDEIEEAQRKGEFSDPDHRPDDEEERGGPDPDREKSE
jgi:hypothetical protein